MISVAFCMPTEKVSAFASAGMALWQILELFEFLSALMLLSSCSSLPIIITFSHTQKGCELGLIDIKIWYSLYLFFTCYIRLMVLGSFIFLLGLEYFWLMNFVSWIDWVGMSSERPNFNTKGRTNWLRMKNLKKLYGILKNPCDQKNDDDDWIPPVNWGRTDAMKWIGVRVC